MSTGTGIKIRTNDKYTYRIFVRGIYTKLRDKTNNFLSELYYKKLNNRISADFKLKNELLETILKYKVRSKKTLRKAFEAKIIELRDSKTRQPTISDTIEILQYLEQKCL